jgi:hypothetical protein
LKLSQLTFEELEIFNNKVKQGNDALTTPFIPRDYNKGTFKMEFSDEYHALRGVKTNE